MPRFCFAGIAGLLLIPAMAASSGAPARYVEFEGAHLAQGRAIWLANCEGCHGYGVGGAPIPMKPADWAGRLTRDKAVLYEHAVSGFFGPDDTLMPARGGNEALTDEEVKAAVDYMTRLAKFYLDNTR